VWRTPPIAALRRDGGTKKGPADQAGPSAEGDDVLIRQGDYRQGDDVDVSGSDNGIAMTLFPIIQPRMLAAETASASTGRMGTRRSNSQTSIPQKSGLAARISCALSMASSSSGQSMISTLPI
jgi:hypothetical protein